MQVQPYHFEREILQLQAVREAPARLTPLLAPRNPLFCGAVQIANARWHLSKGAALHTSILNIPYSSYRIIIQATHSFFGADDLNAVCLCALHHNQAVAPLCSKMSALKRPFGLSMMLPKLKSSKAESGADENAPPQPNAAASGGSPAKPDSHGPAAASEKAQPATATAAASKGGSSILAVTGVPAAPAAPAAAAPSSPHAKQAKQQSPPARRRGRSVETVDSADPVPTERPAAATAKASHKPAASSPPARRGAAPDHAAADGGEAAEHAAGTAAAAAAASHPDPPAAAQHARGRRRDTLAAASKAAAERGRSHAEPEPSTHVAAALHEDPACDDMPEPAVHDADEQVASEDPAALPSSAAPAAGLARASSITSGGAAPAGRASAAFQSGADVFK